jgi:hypothetical protein
MNTVLVRLDDCYDSHEAVWVNVESIIKIAPRSWARSNVDGSVPTGSVVTQVDGSAFTVNNMEPDAVVEHIRATTLHALGYT